METGRRLGRTWELCYGCNARLTTGEPKAAESWTTRLSLTPEQVKLLLLAAAEYEDLSEEAQHISNAIEFVDWMAVDALPNLNFTETQEQRREQVRRLEKQERDRLRRLAS